MYSIAYSSDLMGGGTNQSKSVAGKDRDPNSFTLEMFKLSPRMLSVDPVHADCFLK